MRRPSNKSTSLGPLRPSDSGVHGLSVVTELSIAYFRLHDLHESRSAAEWVMDVVGVVVAEILGLELPQKPHAYKTTTLLTPPVPKTHYVLRPQTLEAWPQNLEPCRSGLLMKHFKQQPSVSFAAGTIQRTRRSCACCMLNSFR